MVKRGVICLEKAERPHLDGALDLPTGTSGQLYYHNFKKHMQQWVRCIVYYY